MKSWELIKRINNDQFLILIQYACFQNVPSKTKTKCICKAYTSDKG